MTSQTQPAGRAHLDYARLEQALFEAAHAQGPQALHLVSVSFDVGDANAASGGPGELATRIARATRTLVFVEGWTGPEHAPSLRALAVYRRAA